MKELRSCKGHNGPVFTVKFNQSGKYCMSAGNDKTIRLWNPHRDSESNNEALLIKTYHGHHGYAVVDISIASDNSRFASCGKEKHVFVWDISSGAIIRRIPGHEQRINTVTFNAEGTLLVSGSYDKTVRCWDLRTFNRAPVQIIDVFKDSVTCVRLSDYSIVASSVDGYVRNFDLRMGKSYADNLSVPVTHISLSRDNKCMLTSCSDNSDRLLEIQSGKELGCYEGQKNENYSISSCFSNNDSEIFSGSEDGNIYFWDLVQCKLKGKVKAHSNVTCAVDYHPTEPILLSASFDGLVKIWSCEKS